MKTNKGFSLVELIVVIAIMAIIAAVAVPVYNTYIDKSKDSVAQNLADQTARAAKLATTARDITTITFAYDGENKNTMIVTFAGADASHAAAELVQVISQAQDKGNGVVYVTADYDIPKLPDNWPKSVENDDESGGDVNDDVMDDVVDDNVSDDSTNVVEPVKDFEQIVDIVAAVCDEFDLLFVEVYSYSNGIVEFNFGNETAAAYVYKEIYKVEPTDKMSECVQVSGMINLPDPLPEFITSEGY